MKYEGKIYGKVAGKYIEIQPEATAKALVQNGKFVDSTRLNCGIYSCKRPTLYHISSTIESLCEVAEKMKDGRGRCYFEQEYFDNLRSCELVEVGIFTI